MSTQSNKQSSNPTGAALYLRWFGILCAVMAAFCLGVFIIGYKDPSFGRIATFIALAIASPVLQNRRARPPCESRARHLSAAAPFLTAAAPVVFDAPPPGRSNPYPS